MDIKEYVDILSSTAPSPGGGSAAAIVSSIAISLGLMSINVSKNRKSYENHSSEDKEKISKIIEWLERLKKEALEYEEEDEKAFQNYMKVYKSEDEKLKQEAAFKCYNVPYLLLELNVRAVNLISALKPFIVSSITSDFKMALELLKSTMNSCLINMDINIDNVNDKEIKKDCEKAHKMVKDLCVNIDKLLEE